MKSLFSCVPSRLLSELPLKLPVSVAVVAVDEQDDNEQDQDQGGGRGPEDDQEEVLVIDDALKQGCLWNTNEERKNTQIKLPYSMLYSICDVCSHPQSITRGQQICTNRNENMLRI